MSIADSLSLVPGLVSPSTNIVTAADACLDTCVWAGEEHRDGQWTAGSRKSRVISRPHTAAVKTTANRKLNDRCNLWQSASDIIVQKVKNNSVGKN